MANEITLSVFLQFLKSDLAAILDFPRAQLNMSGTNYIHRTQTLDLADTELDLASLAVLGLTLFVNRGTTNLIQIKNEDAGIIIPLLKVGEPCLLRFDTSVIAPTANAIGFVISAATNANPVVFTAAGHGLVSGASVIISGFTGDWTPCNGTFTATVITANTFSIVVNSTAFGAMTGSPVFLATPTLEYLILED